MWAWGSGREGEGKKQLGDTDSVLGAAEERERQGRGEVAASDQSLSNAAMSWVLTL